MIHPSLKAYIFIFLIAIFVLGSVNCTLILGSGVEDEPPEECAETIDHRYTGCYDQVAGPQILLRIEEGCNLLDGHIEGPGLAFFLAPCVDAGCPITGDISEIGLAQLHIDISEEDSEDPQIECSIITNDAGVEQVVLRRSGLYASLYLHRLLDCPEE